MRHFAKNLYPVLLLFLSIIAACNPTHSLTVETLQYPKSPLPKTAQKIAFIDKTCNPDRDSIGFYYILDNSILYSEFPADSTLSSSLINGIKFAVDQIDFFAINDSVVNHSDVYYDEKSKTLQLKKAIDADILISLEQLTDKDITSFSLDYDYYMYYGQIFLRMGAKIHIYAVKQKTLLSEFNLSDSIIWYTYANTVEDAYKSLPKRDEIFPEAYYEFGKYIAQSFIPYWEDVERTIYDDNNNKYLQNGTNSALVNNWDRAKYYWTESSKAKNKSIAAKSYYNLALYEELYGDISKALEFIQKAKSLKEKEKFDLYYQILKNKSTTIEYLKSLESN